MYYIAFKCDLSDFDCGILVRVRKPGLDVSEAADLLGLSLDFIQNSVKNIKHPVRSSPACGNALTIKEEYTNRYKLTGRLQ